MPITAYPPPNVTALCSLLDTWIRQMQSVTGVVSWRKSIGDFGRIVIEGGATQLTLSTDKGPLEAVLYPQGILPPDRPDILLDEQTLVLARTVTLAAGPSAVVKAPNGDLYRCVLARAGQLSVVRLELELVA